MYENIVRSLGSVFDNRKLYGESHKVAVHSLENAFEVLSQTFVTENELVLAVNPDEFHINHQVVETKNALMQAFVDILRGHEISTLTISKGMLPDEFLGFIDLVAQSPEALASSGGIAESLKGEQFSHIGSRKVTYVELAEEEIVVNKSDAETGSVYDEHKAAVMEYFGISSETSSDQLDHAVVASMQTLIEDSAGFGEIIVKSAGKSLDVDIPSDKVLTADVMKEVIDHIVGYLEKTFELLKNDKSSHSQKGKKKLSKSLKSLSRDLGVFLKESLTPIGEEDLNPIYNAISVMTDELEIDALASEYLRKRKLIEASEHHLLKYIENHGQSDDDDLKAKLIEGGLTSHSWEMLMIASGKSPVSGAKWPSNSELPEFRKLQDKLSQLSKIFCNIDPEHATTPEQLQKVISQVEEHLEKLIKNTERRIKVILNKIIADEKSLESRETESSKRLTRRQLLELIAEIVQELYQPLSVVQCVLQSVLSQKIDMESKEQKKFLQLANRSVERLNSLIGELYTVVGNPMSLMPNNLA